ncbi:MAG: M48 family metalloprotease, partial [Dokdonella sp.]
MRRIMLFIATNLAVMLLLTIVVRVFGLDTTTYLNGQLNLQAILVISAVIGFGGSFISLAMSKWIAKWQTKAKVIEQAANPTEAWLLATVRRQADAVGIKMPEVAIYDAPEMNAFATGATRNSALVAISTGLLNQMQQDEIEAVLGHEISH